LWEEGRNRKRNSNFELTLIPESVGSKTD